MDLNYLYHRRGVSTLMSQNATSEQSRAAHRGLAAAYAAKIATARLDRARQEFAK
jgi:hypothetical protein